MTDKLPRKTSPEALAALKAATRESLALVSGKRFALVTRVQAPALSNYGSISEPRDFMPVDILADLQGEFGPGVASPLLEELAAQAGFRLVPIEDDDGHGGVGVDDIANVMREGGEAKAAALKAVGSTCLATVREARREAREAEAEYGALRRRLAGQERSILKRGGV